MKSDLKLFSKQINIFKLTFIIYFPHKFIRTTKLSHRQIFFQYPISELLSHANYIIMIKYNWAFKNTEVH